jgi:hypothetical protein
MFALLLELFLRLLGPQSLLDERVCSCVGHVDRALLLLSALPP